MMHFDKFDVDASGCIGYQERCWACATLAWTWTWNRWSTSLSAATRIKMAASPCRSFHCWPSMQTGHMASAAWSHDMERLANAARVLHEQALSEPLNLVAAGEVPTLLRCAASGHSAIEQLGLSALAAVAESPHAQCAQAIAARPALADVLSALARPSIPLPSVRQGARFLATMCQEAHDAKGLSIRRKIRLRLSEEASPLLYGAFGRRAAADEQAARDIAIALAAFASEPELALRLGVDGAARCGSLASWCVQCARECALRPSRLSARPPPPVVPTYGSLSALGSCTAHRHGCLVALRARDAPRRRAHQRGGEAARRALSLLQYEGRARR